MKTLSIDIETYSSIDLSKCGVYKYTEAPDFDILLFGYSVDGGPVQVVDLASGEKLPAEIVTALTDDTVIKWAFNAQFERICLSRWLRDNGGFDNTGYSIPEDTVCNYLDPASWKCTMVWAAYMGLPLSLEGSGAVLGLDKQKLAEGKDHDHPGSTGPNGRQRFRSVDVGELVEYTPQSGGQFPHGSGRKEPFPAHGAVRLSAHTDEFDPGSLAQGGQHRQGDPAGTGEVYFQFFGHTRKAFTFSVRKSISTARR